MNTDQTIPLSALRLSPLNARQVKDPDKVQDLVAAIRHQGVLQNLCVVMDAKPKKKAMAEVVAGGRRLLALQTLAKAGEIDKDYPVPCKVVTKDDALEVSLSENTQREQMDAISEVRAFAALVEEGVSVEEVAARFGTTPLGVSRRLKLAHVSPTLLDLYPSGAITLDQLMALALVDDHATQEQCWNSAGQWDRQPNQLRRRLTAATPSVDNNPAMTLVGLDAYKAAGGSLTTDLFDTQSGGYVNNPDVLAALAKAKLDEQANALREAGWNAVSVLDGAFYEHDVSRGQRTMNPARRPFTETEQAAVREIEQKITTLNGELEDASGELEADEDNEDLQADVEKKEEAIRVLEDQREDLYAACDAFTEAQRKVGECVVYLSRSGKVEILQGILPKGAKDPEADAADGSRSHANGGSVERAPGFHSETLVKVLTGERSLALQAILMSNPDLALLASLEQLVPRTIASRDWTTPTRCRLSVTVCTNDLLQLIPDEDNTGAAGTVRAAIGRWKLRYNEFMGVASEPDSSPSLEAEDEASEQEQEEDEGDQDLDAGEEEPTLTTMDWLLALTPAERLELHGVCIAMTLDVRRGDDHTREADTFTTHAKLDMREWWTPTAKRYFAFLNKKQILAVLASVNAPSEGLDKLKKNELAERAEALMKDCARGWLPTPLQG